jgi:hypothetical protein
MQHQRTSLAGQGEGLPGQVRQPGRAVAVPVGDLHREAQRRPAAYRLLDLAGQAGRHLDGQEPFAEYPPGRP